jgi:hypothetical protein
MAVGGRGGIRPKLCDPAFSYELARPGAGFRIHAEGDSILFGVSTNFLRSNLKAVRRPKTAITMIAAKSNVSDTLTLQSGISKPSVQRPLRMSSPTRNARRVGCVRLFH